MMDRAAKSESKKLGKRTNRKIIQKKCKKGLAFLRGVCDKIHYCQADV